MFCRIDGVDIYVRDVNPGSRETVLFLHGWPLDGSMFEYQFDTLAEAGIRCIAIDLPGYGLSGKPFGGYDYESMADMLHKLMTELKLSGVTLAGFSMGGGIAATYAAKYGAKLVSKLILIGAACPSFTQRPGFPYGMTDAEVNGLIKNLRADKPNTFAEFSKLLFESPVSAGFQSWLSGITDKAALLSARKGLETLRDEDLREKLKSIGMPTLICHGVHDRVCPFALAEETQKRIPRSRLVRFDNSGHDIFFAEKDKLSSEIAMFVRPVSAAAINEDSFDAMTYKFENLPLPYPYDALEPNIDTQTMHIHHDRHLQTYVNNLNTALAPYPMYQDWTLVRLLANLGVIPAPLSTAVRRNAGGVFNHFFYFEGMTNKATAPSPELDRWLANAFGGTTAFIKTLKDAALGVFGSGYAWLVLDAKGRPAIVTTKNQDCPISENMFPLLNVDVWEHAYYLKHFNDRAAYLDNFMNVINWEMIEKRLKSVI